MENAEPISIRLATGSKVVLDSMCTVPIIFCKVNGYAITQHLTCWIMENLSYVIFLFMDWLKSTNLIIDWVACSLELSVGDNLHNVLALPVNNAANDILFSLK